MLKFEEKAPPAALAAGGALYRSETWNEWLLSD